MTAHKISALGHPLIGKDKSKVVPVLFLTEHHTMKAYWEMEV
jgi:hypothetical protein